MAAWDLKELVATTLLQWLEQRLFPTLQRASEDLSPSRTAVHPLHLLLGDMSATTMGFNLA